jgi:beta-phosphoglucomutase
MPDWPDAVLFDFDGVLVNSEPLHFQALQRVAAEASLPLTEAQYYDDLLGHDDRGLIRTWLTAAGKTPTPGEVLRLATRKKVIAESLIHEKRYDALPGVEAVVRGLWRTYPLAICSGALGTEIELILDGIRLRDCFRVIVSAEDVTMGKPDPECYLRGVELLAGRYHRRLNPRNCLVFEDAPRVIDRLKPLGFVCVGVTNENMPASRFDNADYVIDAVSPDQVKAKIPRLNLFEA